jgi:F1F0 ATPase subunit 2
MGETSALLLALPLGFLLGATFFGGLWWTVLKCVSSARPAALLLGSLVLRTTLAVSGFYVVSRGDWRRTLACLFGFLVARVFVTRITRASTGRGTRVVEGGAA